MSANSCAQGTSCRGQRSTPIEIAADSTTLCGRPGLHHEIRQQASAKLILYDLLIGVQLPYSYCTGMRMRTAAYAACMSQFNRRDFHAHSSVDDRIPAVSRHDTLHT